MVLTSIDYQNIANLIEVGSDTIEYAKGNEVIFIGYTYSETGYTEDDYFNGTGAYVVTSRHLSVEAADSYDSEGETTQNDFAERHLLAMVA